MASVISPRAEVSAKAKIGNNCKIYPFAYIEDDVVIGDGCVIFPFVSILNGTRMGNKNKIHQGSVIGALPQDPNFIGEKTEVVLGDSNVIRENVVINRATHAGGQTVIGNNNFLMEGAHISHDTKIGDRCVLSYGAKIGGDCEIGNGVILGSAVIQHGGTRVGNGVVVKASTTFAKDVPPYIIAGGSPVGYQGVNVAMCEQYGVEGKVVKHIANAYRLVFHGKTDPMEACRQIVEQVPDSPEIQNIVSFIRSSKGII